MRLAQRVQFDGYFAGTGHGQQAHGRRFVQDKAIWIIVHQQNIVCFRKGHEAREEGQPGRRAGGHVRVIHQHELHLREVGLGQRVQVGQPAVGGRQVVFAHLSPAYFGHGTVRRVAGIGDEHRVASFQKRHSDVHQAFFRAQQWQDFSSRVQRHAVAPLVEVRHGPAQGGRALVALVAVGRGLRRRRSQGRRHAGVRRQIRTTNPQADNVGPGRIENGQLAQLAREVVFAGMSQAAGNGDIHVGIRGKVSKLPSLPRRGRRRKAPAGVVVGVGLALS